MRKIHPKQLADLLILFKILNRKSLLFARFSDRRHIYTFAAQAVSPLVKEIHKRVTEVKQNKDMEVEYMTLLQRDRENLELGREEGHREGTLYATRIIKLYHKGFSNEEITSSLQLDLEYVDSVISDYEND